MNIQSKYKDQHIINTQQCLLPLLSIIAASLGKICFLSGYSKKVIGSCRNPCEFVFCRMFCIPIHSLSPKLSILPNAKLSSFLTNRRSTSPNYFYLKSSENMKEAVVRALCKAEKKTAEFLMHWQGPK